MLMASHDFLVLYRHHMIWVLYLYHMRNLFPRTNHSENKLPVIIFKYNFLEELRFYDVRPIPTTHPPSDRCFRQ